jgi:putative oxygen-independent coproporphyrinogen III oxidase
MQISLPQSRQSIELKALPPLSLYVHFPWCVRKCPYCDFNSHQIKDPSSLNTGIGGIGGIGGFDEENYLKSLRLDLEATLPLVWGRRIHSIFIGGGTPSLLSPEGMDQLLADIRARLPMDADIEITMEANPGTVEADKFASFSKSGINRLSLGIQSFNNSKLQALGRIHNGSDANKAIEIALKYFSRVNLDLMYALPEQTTDEALQDLKHALSFKAEHLSLYHLTLEPNTLFAKFPPNVPDDDSAFEMQDSLWDVLASQGYDRYEISAFTNHKKCTHNLNYWSFGDYIGIGAGAHGKISFPNRILRTSKERHPDTYMRQMLELQKADLANRDVTSSELPFEFMLNALRLVDGVPTEYFSERTGLPISSIAGKLKNATEKKLLVSNPSRLAASDLGLQYLNDLQMIFL